MSDALALFSVALIASVLQRRYRSTIGTETSSPSFSSSSWRAAKGRLYDSCKLMHNGTLLAHIPAKRRDWYLARGLARQLEDGAIELLFEPRGPGNAGDEFYLSDHLDRCVCCGAERELTKHHVVVREYRRHFPLAMKSRNSHDVVVLCVPCHDRYEIEAMKLKKQLARQYDAPLEGRGRSFDRETRRAQSHASALLHARDKLPKERVRELVTLLNEFLDGAAYDPEHGDIPGHVLREILQREVVIDAEGKYKSHGELLVGRLLEECQREGQCFIAELDKFCRMWRQHFVDVMNPRFLNEHWDVNRSAFREISE